MSARALCAAAAAATIVACAAAGGPQKAAEIPSVASAPAPQTLPQPSSPQDDQIAEYARAIEEQRQQLGLPAPNPTGKTGAVAMSQDEHPSVAPTAPTQPTCHPASETCTQACTLSGSICDNAKKICDIASELPGDAWASNKCVEGNETCAAAKKRCCDCAP